MREKLHVWDQMEEVDVPWGVYVTLGVSILSLSAATGEPELFSFAGVVLGLISWARARGVKLPGKEEELNLTEPDLRNNASEVDEKLEVVARCVQPRLRHTLDSWEGVGSLGEKRLRWGTGKVCNQRKN